MQELGQAATAVFPAPSDRDRVKSVLADLSKTASDFRIIASKGLDMLANGILPHLRWGYGWLRLLSPAGRAAVTVLPWSRCL